MLQFGSDYMEGAHPAILAKLQEMNFVSQPGYGTDDMTASAMAKIKEACGLPEAEVCLIAGGTQTNSTIISTMLHDSEGVVAADTGHVAVHEAGAIEYTGHKVLVVKGVDGKLKAPDVKAFIQNFYDDGNHEHMVYPGMVYISHPTENGTLYTRKELADLSAVCHEYDIPLFLDGARLGYGLAAAKLENYETLPSLQEIAQLADVFYIGGTKVGALIGEAVVFTKNNMPKRFVTQIKRRGALLAKGFLLGTMFDVLFTDDLYMKNGVNGIETARYMADGLRKLGCKFYMESPTNQQYLVLDNETMAKLSEKVGFSFWEKVDDTHTAIRFCTSWATTKEKVDELLAIMAEL